MKLNRKSAWERYVDEAETLAPDVMSAADTVFNGSFEAGAGAFPDGWRLVSGAPGDSTEWCLSGGVDGGRCLRISPRGGGASWYARPVPITGGAEYVFRCAIKREGVRHWAHACDISWVSLVFHGEGGAPLRTSPEQEQPMILVRTRHTDGWVRSWRHLVAPEDARTLWIGFRLVRGEPRFDDPHGFRRFWHGEIDTGQWWIDDVRLERMPLAVSPAHGVLTVHVPGQDARLRVSNTHGETFAPRDCVAYEAQGGCFHGFREDVRIDLAPGNYTVEAMRGFQREPYYKSVEIAEGHETRITAELPRVADWPALGWYAGDHHNHLAFHGSTRHPLMTIDDVHHVARGEGLDFLSFCGEIVDLEAYTEWRDGGRPPDARPDGAVERDDFLGVVSHEVTNDVLGHLCLINPPGDLQPGHPWWPAPTNAAIGLAMRRGGRRGAVVMAHPYDGLSKAKLFDVLADPARTGHHRELPADIALGFGDTMDILTVESPGDLDLRFTDYFRLLNLGLRIGVSGASDAYADQGTEIPGSILTFVRSDRLHMETIAMGYEMRRTMASNGPLLSLKVNDRDIGSTVAGPMAILEAEAFSNWGLKRLEILYNGRVIGDATPDDEGWARIRMEFEATGSGWFIARAWGPGHPCLNTSCVPADRRSEQGQWAVSSPIHIDVPGRPLVPKREDADYFLRWLDAASEAVRTRRGILEGRCPYGPEMREEDVRTTLDVLQRGRDMLRNLV